MLCILLTELDTKGGKEKGKNKNQENKAKSLRDDKVSLKHTKNIRIPTGVFVCAYKYQITNQTVSILSPGSLCLHHSQVTVITASLLRQEGKVVWHKETCFLWEGYRNHIRFSEKPGKLEHWFFTWSLHC